MKKGLTYLFVAGVMVASLASVSFAMKDHGIKGEVTKIEGEMLTFKDAKGKEHTVHVATPGTVQEGDIKVGAHVVVDADKSGHANSIKAEKAGKAAKH